MKGISATLKDLFSTSIQTKLTLAGIFSGLGAAAYSAGKSGQQMMIFKNAFGLSLQELQKMQYVARQFGVGADEVTTSIKSIQDAIAKARYDSEFAEFFTSMGIDIEDQKLNAFDVIKQIQTRVKTGNLDLARVRASSVLSPEVFSFLRRSEDLTKAMAKVPMNQIFSDAQLAKQEKIAVSFANFGADLQKSMEKFVADNQPLFTTFIDTFKNVLLDFMTFVKNNQGMISELTKTMGELVIILGELVLLIPAQKIASATAWTLKNNPIDKVFNIGESFGKKLMSSILGEDNGPSVGFRPPSLLGAQSTGTKSEVNNFIFNDVEFGSMIQESSKNDFYKALNQINRGTK